MRFGWYLSRLRRMSAGEIAGRTLVVARQRHWARRGARPGGLASLLPGVRHARGVLRRVDAPSGKAAEATVRAAEGMLAGIWPVFDRRAAAVGAVPDWFRDPLSGTVSAAGTYAFDVPYRDEGRVGNVKYLWEMSRHQAATVLAAAWWITGEERFAAGLHAQLASWWAANPFLDGVHWTSGIEVGIRLLSWVYIRALLGDWPGAPSLFEQNELFLRQLYHHLLYLRRLHSRGSSANNHLLAELAGVAAACAAFPWFAESAGWGSWARRHLAAEAQRQTHPDGFNREQASAYHPFVFELLAAPVLALRLAGEAVPAGLDDVLRRMADAQAASLDQAGRPPRFGDGDDGRGLLLDAPEAEPVAVMLDVGRALYGAAAWWPDLGRTVLGHVAGLTAGPRPERASARPDVFAGLGMTILRDGDLWVRCDAGPHGFLSIGAHGHADALSLEVRVGGAEVICDPGTYCYHGEKPWRDYFKGTRAHATLRVAEQDQARSAGPFLWLDQPESRVEQFASEGAVKRWAASHDGYRRLGTTHHRRVTLDGAGRSLVVEDWLDAGQAWPVELIFPFGPEIMVTLDGMGAALSWPGSSGRMALACGLTWTLHRGETAPPLGWYSRGFGHKTPSFLLLGRGVLPPSERLETRIWFRKD